jgi:signal transduction histidine kinase
VSGPAGPSGSRRPVAAAIVRVLRRAAALLFPRSAVTSKILAAVLAILLAVIAVQAFLDARMAHRNNENEERERLLAGWQSYSGQIGLLERESAALAVSFAEMPAVRRLTASQDREGLLELLAPVYRSLRQKYLIAHLYIHRPNGFVLLRVHDPDHYGDALGSYRRTPSAVIVSRQPVSGVELDPDRLGIRGVAPVFNDGEFVGMVEVGLNYDKAFIDDMKNRTGVDYRIWITYDAAAPTGFWPKGTEPPAPTAELFSYVSTTSLKVSLPPAAYRQVLAPQAGEQVRFVTAEGKSLAVLLAPLHEFGGRTIGVVEVISSRTEALGRLRRNQAATASVAALLGVLSMALMGLAVGLVVLRSLRHLTDVTRRLLAGDHHARVTLFPRDEFGDLGRVFNSMTDEAEAHMKNLEDQVQAIRRAEQEKEKLAAQLLQAQKMESIGRLAGGVAHDFNNLLTPIIGYAGLLSSGDGSLKDPASMAAEILSAGRRARDLVAQLLAFSRKQVLEMKVCDLNAVAAGFRGILRSTIRENIDITFDAFPGLWPVRADRSQIEQIIMNLAVNAQDAMPSGGTMTLETSNVVVNDSRAASDPRPGDYACLLFRDTGHGIAPDILPHIFEPFFTTKSPGTGTGLGLATVFGIVTQHGGSISVESRGGRGTAFRILLPRAEEAAREEAEVPSASSHAAGGKTVLLVEDTHAVRRMIGIALGLRGYRVLEAADGPAAIELAGTHPETIDVLLTDIIMPGMNGVDLFRRLAAARPTLKVIYMSGYAGAVIADQGIEDENFIQKPFTTDALLSKLARSIG